MRHAGHGLILVPGDLPKQIIFLDLIQIRRNKIRGKAMQVVDFMHAGQAFRIRFGKTTGHGMVFRLFAQYITNHGRDGRTVHAT